MKLALITDAWAPQVNGVVTTLIELTQHLREAGHEVTVIEPGQFPTRPCPGYAGIDLAVRPKAQLTRMLDTLQPEAVHVATEGPLGWSARRYCLRNRMAFTTAFHTKFPEIANAALRLPVWVGYAAVRHFHRPSAGVMVPSQSVLEMLASRGFSNLRPWTHGVDTDSFPFHAVPRADGLLSGVPRPIHLFVGRVSYEKNIDAFLRARLPGSKVVCGVGPVLDALRKRHADVVWLGVLPREQLATVYAQADVLVFPSRADTFGLVMVEAMATGTPVAAFPVDGPLEVLGRRHADGSRVGGSLDTDLVQACARALRVPRSEARSRALDFNWARAAEIFAGHLVPARNARDADTHAATEGVIKLS